MLCTLRKHCAVLFRAGCASWQNPYLRVGVAAKRECCEPLKIGKVYEKKLRARRDVGVWSSVPSDAPCVQR